MAKRSRAAHPPRRPCSSPGPAAHWGTARPPPSVRLWPGVSRLWAPFHPGRADTVTPQSSDEKSTHRRCQILTLTKTSPRRVASLLLGRGKCLQGLLVRSPGSGRPPAPPAASPQPRPAPAGRSLGTYLKRTFSSMSSGGSRVMRLTSSSMHCCRHRKPSSFWFWALHSCRTSSSSISSRRVTSSLSNSLSTWDVLFKSNFQNMVTARKLQAETEGVTSLRSVNSPSASLRRGPARPSPAHACARRHSPQQRPQTVSPGLAPELARTSQTLYCAGPAASLGALRLTHPQCSHPLLGSPRPTHPQCPRCQPWGCISHPRNVTALRPTRPLRVQPPPKGPLGTSPQTSLYCIHCL